VRYKLLGRSGIRVSELCLGAMVLGDTRGRWGATREDAQTIVNRFAEAGGTSSTRRATMPAVRANASSASSSPPTATAGCWRRSTPAALVPTTRTPAATTARDPDGPGRQVTTLDTWSAQAPMPRIRRSPGTASGRARSTSCPSVPENSTGERRPALAAWSSRCSRKSRGGRTWHTCSRSPTASTSTGSASG
jgi:hypothetical protein